MLYFYILANAQDLTWVAISDSGKRLPSPGTVLAGSRVRFECSYPDPNSFTSIISVKNGDDSSWTSQVWVIWFILTLLLWAYLLFRSYVHGSLFGSTNCYLPTYSSYFIKLFCMFHLVQVLVLLLHTFGTVLMTAFLLRFSGVISSC